MEQHRIDKVNGICRSVLKLTDADFQAIDQMAKKQLNYIHPLRMAKVIKLNALGKYNLKVLKALQSLQITLKQNPHLK